MAATAGPSSEGPDDDAVVDETTLRFILVRALSARSKPRDPTPVSDAYRGAARRAPGARADGEKNPPILPDAQNRFFRSSSSRRVVERLLRLPTIHLRFPPSSLTAVSVPLSRAF